MNCERIGELMSRSVDCTITLPERMAMEAHLEECDRCRAEYARVRGFGRMLSEELPLQITPGDRFAADVVRNLPERRSYLSLLKEAFTMSRFRYAMVGLIALAIAVSAHFSSRGLDSVAFAAIQSAMSDVKSVHYVVRSTMGPKACRMYEGWSTPSATSVRQGRTVLLLRDSSIYFYSPDMRLLCIAPEKTWGPAVVFAGIIDPKAIAKARNVEVTRVASSRASSDGKPVVRVETISRVKLAPEHVQALRYMQGFVSQRLPGSKYGEMRVGRSTRLRSVYLVDPTSHLVKSMEQYVPCWGRGWTLVGRTTMIEYNKRLPKRIFDLPRTAPGTDRVDMRRWAFLP